MWHANRTESYSRNRLSGDKIQRDTHKKYQPQIQVKGNDPETQAAAE